MEAAPALDYKVLYEQQKVEIAALRHELALLKKMIFGSRHERFEPGSAESNQLTLDLAVGAITTAAETETKEVTIAKTITKNKSNPVIHPGRSPLPASLRREEIT